MELKYLKTALLNLDVAFENFEEIFKSNKSRCICSDIAFENLKEAYRDYKKLLWRNEL